MSSTEPGPETAAVEATDAQTTAASPTADRLAVAFETIHRERMAGLPILHPALRVAVVGGRPWQGHWLGVLVTPWCMNLVLVPAAGSALAQAPEGTAQVLDFPAGAFEFTVSALNGFGRIAACSLFSPMQRFADQAAAEATAAAVMVSLFEPESESESESERGAGAGATAAAAPTPRTGLSRRDLLRGSFRGR